MRGLMLSRATRGHYADRCLKQKPGYEMEVKVSLKIFQIFAGNSLEIKWSLLNNDVTELKHHPRISSCWSCWILVTSKVKDYIKLNSRYGMGLLSNQLFCEGPSGHFIYLLYTVVAEGWYTCPVFMKGSVKLTLQPTISRQLVQWYRANWSYFLLSGSPGIFLFKITRTYSPRWLRNSADAGLSGSPFTTITIQGSLSVKIPCCQIPKGKYPSTSPLA